MGLLDFLKKNEFKEIEELKNENASLSEYKEIGNIAKQKEALLISIKDEQEKAELKKTNILSEIKALEITRKELSDEIIEKKDMIVELDETILLQEFGMYKPVYNFASSDIYKDRLDRIKQEQKQMIVGGSAAVCAAQWVVEGSEAKGKAMTNQNIKQILRCFNDECDTLIDKVKFNNIEAYTKKATKSYDALNKINSKNQITISKKYLQLKLDELNLSYEYAVKKQEEKEEQKRIREQLREEAKLQKEIEDARKDIEKEQKHYTNALSKLDIQLNSCNESEKETLLEKRKEIEEHLTELNTAILDIDYRDANKRAGYVYIISNIGSFGENIYKIGMTRRLDPMERVDELGDASVPFRFDVHAIIFSEDAPKLESILHKTFEHKKVNMINGRREFFKVTLDEIEVVIKNNYDKTVEFNKVPLAEQYRESIKILESLTQ